MELLQLKYFRSAATTENFSHTAKKFMVPQSTISQTIKKLEGELGFKLFDRIGNRVYLNENGKIFKEAVDSGLNAINSAAKSLKEASGEKNGTVSLIINTNRRFVSECIAEFKEKHPEVRFTVNHISEDVYDGVDIIIDDRNSNHPNTESEILIEERMLLGVNKNHRLANKTEVTFNDIADEVFISIPAGNSLHRILEHYFYSKGLAPKIDIFCDDPYFIRKYIKINLGIALWPEFSWFEMNQADISLIPISDMDFTRVTCLYTSKSFSANSAAQKFAEHLKQKANKTQNNILKT